MTAAQKIRLLCKQGPVTRRDVELALQLPPAIAHNHIRSLLRHQHIKPTGFCYRTERRGPKTLTQYTLTQAGIRKMNQQRIKERKG